MRAAEGGEEEAGRSDRDGCDWDRRDADESGREAEADSSRGAVAVDWDTFLCFAS
jgi:hypothetical protein